ncbi:MAG: hypothetical protein K2X93_28795 [Candidatus Obscuribacterales bacterium]|nr:hypothetical protein [Candidatus Obscuribacterales bacterium]
MTAVKDLKTVFEAEQFSSERPLHNVDKALLSCYSIVFLAVVCLQLFVYQSLNREVFGAVRYIEIATGWTQWWSAFSHPTDRNFYCSVISTFEDGSIGYRELPRMDKMSQMERFTHQKLYSCFHKYFPMPGYEPLFPDVCKWLIHRYSTNQPIMVSVICNTAVFGPPKKPVLRDRLPAHTQKSVVVVYCVRNKNKLAGETATAELSELPK